MMPISDVITQQYAPLSISKDLEQFAHATPSDAPTPTRRPLPPLPAPGTVGRQSPPRPLPSTKLQAHYVGEKTDGRHRMGDLLSIFAAVYNERYMGKDHLTPILVSQLPEDRKKAGYFFGWMSQLPDAEARSILGKKFKNRESLEEFFYAFRKGVAYLDAKARIDHSVVIQNGAIHWMQGRKWKWTRDPAKEGPVVLDTARMSTMARGRGWAIWVLVRDKGTETFYTASHELGTFHHSSFNSGMPIVAGGEWKVVNGAVVAINGKTGHYQTEVGALRYALLRLKAQGVDVDQTDVMLHRLDDTSNFLVKAPVLLANQVTGAFDLRLVRDTRAAPRMTMATHRQAKA